MNDSNKDESDEDNYNEHMTLKEEIIVKVYCNPTYTCREKMGKLAIITLLTNIIESEKYS